MAANYLSHNIACGILKVMTEIENLLKSYLDYLEVEKNRSPKTRENYERYLCHFIKQGGVSKLRDMTLDAIKDFRLALAREKTPSGEPLKKVTQSYYVIAIRNFLKYLAKQDYNVPSPEKIELPKLGERQIEIIEYAELERLLAAPSGTDLRALRDRAIFEMLFSTGLRVSELCKLSRYIDLKKGELSVRGKGDKLRVVFISDSARKAVETYLAARGDADEALFVSMSKARQPKVLGRIIPRTIQRLIQFYGKKAGIVGKRLTPHGLRHLFATDLLVNGADLRSVQELLGHRNVSTTQVYTHLTNKELKEIHKSFHGKRRD